MLGKKIRAKEQTNGKEISSVASKVAYSSWPQIKMYELATSR